MSSRSSTLVEHSPRHPKVSDFRGSIENLTNFEAELAKSLSLAVTKVVLPGKLHSIECRSNKMDGTNNTNSLVFLASHEHRVVREQIWDLYYKTFCHGY